MSQNTHMFWLGVVLIAVPVLLAIPFFKWCFEIDREQFERTNAHGVRDYASYEDMRRDVKREGAAKGIGELLILPGLGSIALGILMIVVAVNSK